MKKWKEVSKFQPHPSLQLLWNSIDNFYNVDKNIDMNMDKKSNKEKREAKRKKIKAVSGGEELWEGEGEREIHAFGFLKCLLIWNVNI